MLPPLPRWISTRRARTSGTAATGLTAPVTASPRIGSLTSTPSTAIVGAPGSVVEVSVGWSARAATATGSETSTPRSSMYQAMARYIAPVSR